MFTDQDMSPNVETWASAWPSKDNFEIEEYTPDRVYMVGQGISRMFILVQRIDFESQKLK